MTATVITASVLVAVSVLFGIIACSGEDMAATPPGAGDSEVVLSEPRDLQQLQRNRSCTHEGLVYVEGQQVTIADEPCVNCSCQQGSLVCYLRVCPRLPNPPPPECVLVHRKNHCCPQLNCRDSGTSKKKFDVRSDVIPGASDAQPDRACVANGTLYAEGSAMHSSGLCDYCYCIRGRQQCVQPQCLLPLEGCTPGYRALSCCPTHYNCSQAAQTTTTSTAPSSFVGCELDSHFYPEGEMVQAVARSQCENCFCIKGKVQCIPLECAPPLLGCSPVMTPGKCCPTSYNCSASALELTEGTFPAYGSDNNHLELYSDSKSNTITKRKHVSTVRSMPGSLMKSKNHYQQQVANEGRSNHNADTKWAENTTTVELNETSTGTPTTTSVTTVETTTDEMSSDTTTITSTVTTDVTTIQSTTVSLLSTLEASEDVKVSESDVQERQGDSPTEGTADESLMTTVTTTFSDEDENPMTMQTETTFMTSLPTTMIIPEDMYVANITVHSNVTIVEREDNSTAVNGSLPPVRAISPEIEAILNITHKKDDDYEYDYNEPSLPPSLPNLRIIPFVAADAVLEEDDEVDRPTVYPTQDKHIPTDNPLYYKVSHPNRFSPPIETEDYSKAFDSIEHRSILQALSTKGVEGKYIRLLSNIYRQNFAKKVVVTCVLYCFPGGFVPREPIIDGPFYETKYEVPYHTTGLNIPDGHMPVDITSGTIIPPSITMLPKTDDEHCLSDGREFRHGELISDPSACIMCVCYYGEVLCQEGKCPHVKTGCRRLKEKEHGVCCGRIVCDDDESPTVVLDRKDVTPSSLQTLQQQPPPHHLGGIVPPITVADGVVTPDPFRDVIRTEPAPDLPSLIEDMMPFLLERHTATTFASSTTPLASSSTTSVSKPSFPIQEEESTTETSKIQTSSLPDISPITLELLNETKVVSEENNPQRNDDTEDQLSKEEDDEDEDEDSGLSLDSVLQFLFSGGDTTKAPLRTTNPPSNSSTPQLSSSSFEEMVTTSHNTVSSTIGYSSQPISDTNKASNKNFSGNTVDLNTSSNNQDDLNFTTDSNLANTKFSIIPPLVLTAVLNNMNTISPDTSSSHDPPSGRPPNLSAEPLHHPQLPAPVSADLGAASGLLKLAGCNIYGRMYRVGRIISELSGPCLECMCTEVGVQCRPLDC
ncbi:mucin-2 [Periplaneta americana]|uniref:mucin-2 n=1 Tax=Periplaneta americana TaxID=6978 RepID=UPI0037E93156